MCKRQDSGAPGEGAGDVYKPDKAYKNAAFLGSRDARPIRVLCELSETEQRLKAAGVHNTILFYGSARARPPAAWAAQLEAAEADLASASDEEARAAAQACIDRLHKCKWMSDLYSATADLSERLTRWATTRPGSEDQAYVICTGGGPGMMEAANLGAARVEGALSMGMGISLPFEAGLNDHVTRGLGFEFHYFMLRKFWMVYPARAVVVAPGGLGTLDELFETLTLLQTGKIRLHAMPIVLLGKQYWSSVINLQAMVDAGTISEGDVKRMYMTDDVEDAFQYITSRLEALEEEGAIQIGSTSSPTAGVSTEAP